jgi:hypothetical protein
VDKITIEIEGLTNMKKSFSELASNLLEVVDAEMEEGAREFIVLAHRDAPVDEAELKRMTQYKKLGTLNYDIFSQTSYAAYMEFGTKGNYRPVPGAEAIAAQFHNKKQPGTFKDMLRSIARWVKRKGISGTYSVKTRRRTGSKINQLAEDYAAAWPIAMSILKNGVKAHPYFFKQQGIVVPKMIERINRAIDNLL